MHFCSQKFAGLYLFWKDLGVGIRALDECGGDNGGIINWNEV